MDAEVSRFIGLTGAAADQAQFFLEATGGNLERAVAMYYEQGPGSPRAVRNADVPPRPARAPAAVTAAHGAGAGGGPPRRAGGLLTALAMVPVTVLRGTFSIVFRTLGITISVANFVGSRLLPAPLMDGIRGFATALASSSQEQDADASAAAFVRAFSSRYGAVRPRWAECGWTEAAQRAHAQFKFLFVYLHSPHHQDTDWFCRDTLCAPEVVEYVNRTFVPWAGNVTTSDAFRLHSSLRVSRFPYLALLAYSGANVRLVTYVEGAVGPGQLLDLLGAAYEEHAGLMAAEAAAVHERDTNRRLREEQDAAYQRSLAVDREREAARESERRKADAAARAASEAEARKRAEAEERERAAAEYAANLERRRQTKRAALAPEPAAGTPGTCQLKIRLPDGSNALRRFAGCSPLRDVTDFVESLDFTKALTFRLVNTFPRKEYTEADMDSTLESLGLCPMAALFVQPKDE